jgi:hypothetical protein
MVVLALAQGFRVAEIDIKLLPRLHGKSKYTGIWRMFVGFFDLLAVWFSLTFMRKPMLFFGTLGFLSLALAFLLGILAIILRFGYDLGYRPLLNLITLLAQIGFTLFIFGALAEMIASLREKIDLCCMNKSNSNTSSEPNASSSSDYQKKDRYDSRRSSDDSRHGSRFQKSDSRDERHSDRPRSPRPARERSSEIKTVEENVSSEQSISENTNSNQVDSQVANEQPLNNDAPKSEIKWGRTRRKGGM